MDQTLPSFFYTRKPALLLFAGGTGVGKTSCALATAVKLARDREGEAILFVAINPDKRLFDKVKSTFAMPNMEMVRLESEALLDEFKIKHNRVLGKISAKEPFLYEDNINQFIEFTLPALDEVLAFIRVFKWVEAKKYRVIITDRAPGIQTMRLLRKPELVVKWLDTLDTLLTKQRYIKQGYSATAHLDELDLFLREFKGLLKEMLSLLRNAERCRIVPLTSADAVNVRETEVLLKEAERMEIKIRDIVFNRLYPKSICSVCKNWHTQQLTEMDFLIKKSCLKIYNLWGVPLQNKPLFGFNFALSFWENATRIVTDRDRAAALPAFGEFMVEKAAPVLSGHKKLFVFAGKGGKNKAALVSAAALRASADFKNRKALLFSSDPDHSLAACLDSPLGPEPREIRPGLSVMDLDVRSGLEQFKKEYSSELEEFFNSIPANLDLSYDRELMRRLMEFVPKGLDELIALKRVLGLMESEAYDLFIFDASGPLHLISLLESPLLLTQWIKTFFEVFLKYKGAFRLQKVSRRLVELPQHIKQLHYLLAGSRQTDLFVLSDLVNITPEEIKRLVGACGRLGINVPGLFLMLNAKGSECPMCSVLYRQEEEKIRTCRLAFPALEQTIVYLRDNFYGLPKLEKLGQSLFGASPSSLPPRYHLERQYDRADRDSDKILPPPA